MNGRCALALALWIVFLTPFAAAQTTPIRSGEHTDFTRLVFPARAGLTWSVARAAPDRITLTFDDPAMQFDTATVFDRIPRSRLARIGSEGPALTLDLACACDLEISQIGSGHIVMDIAAAPEKSAEATVPPRPRLPLRLPSRQDLFTGFAARSTAPRSAPEAEPATSDARTEPAPPPPIEPARSAQISIRTIGRTPILRGDPAPEPSEVTRLACPEETVAADLLQQDPAAAIGRVTALRTQLIDEAGRPVAEAFRSLAEAYLASGLGAEAGHVLRMSPEPPDPVLIGIADALDGMPDFTEASARFNAACGPATAILALLTGVTQNKWRSVDTRAIAPFVDTLPRAARADLLPRLRPALARLGQPDLLSLDPPPRDPPVPPLPMAAGTNAPAVMATISQLEDPGGQSGEDALANGLALRDSVPDGPLRDELDRALAIALVTTGHLTEAVRVIGDRPALAGTVLTRAARTLSAEELAVAAIRLRPALADGGPASDIAVDTLRQFGLDGLAAGFGIRADGRAPAEGATVEEDTWIVRDVSGLDPETPRGQLAALRRSRNAAPPGQDDFARAASAAEDSARVSEVVLSLIGGTD